jgi:hypothetical protein
MKLPKAPLTTEEENEICKKCGGFCCKYYFFNPGEDLKAQELHKFRQRKMVKYGKVTSVIMSDKCPYSDDETGWCSKYDDHGFPKLCKDFPERYRPFWNLRCKLMRVRYARGLIPKDEEGFRKLRMACGCKPRPVFKYFK